MHGESRLFTGRVVNFCCHVVCKYVVCNMSDNKLITNMESNLGLTDDGIHSLGDMPISWEPEHRARKTTVPGTGVRKTATLISIGLRGRLGWGSVTRHVRWPSDVVGGSVTRQSEVVGGSVTRHVQWPSDVIGGSVTRHVWCGWRICDETRPMTVWCDWRICDETRWCGWRICDEKRPMAVWCDWGSVTRHVWCDWRICDERRPMAVWCDWRICDEITSDGRLM